MEKIVNVWFEKNRIYVQTSKGNELSRPLEAFPRLFDASPIERLNYKIGKFGDDIRWENIDEDIHITSFFEAKEPNYDNEIARLFRLFPELNVSEIARSMGINKSLLAKYIYGITNPSEDRIGQIRQALNTLGHTLISETEEN